MLKILTSFIVVTAALTGCQTLTSSTPSSTEYNKKPTKNQMSMTVNTEVMDSDGDGVADAVEACPDTPSNVVVDKEGCPVLVSLPMGYSYGGSYLFSINSSQLDISRYGADFKKFAQVIMPGCVVKLSGHISRYENTERNKTLASDRVEFVKNYLVVQHNINPEQIITAHYGVQRPTTPFDASYEDSKIDQRVDVNMVFDEHCIKPTD